MAATVERPPTPEQHAAIEAPGVVFVSAGAGTGKTTVLVERFVRAVDSGVDVGSILVITYTDRAAAELRARIRARLAELGRPGLVRELDGAWLSTIHGFCHRLLKQYPFAAGLDPRFRVLDESQATVLRVEAFDDALTEFCRGGEPERLALLATYGSRALRRMLTGVYETLRSAGRPLELSLGDSPGLEQRLEDLHAAAAGLGAEGAARMVELLDRKPPAESLLDLSEYSVRGEEDYEQARAAVEQAALNAVAARDRDLLQELLQGFERSYQAAKDRESALDFEDLQLRARQLLRSDEAIRGREQLRFRQVCVDEFQDTNRLQCELIDLLAREELFFVGDEFQSIYRFRHADVEVFKERREHVGEVLPLTQNWRSRPEILAVVNHLFAETFGDDFQRLVAAGRFPDPASGPAVELLVTDKASYKDTGVTWRRGEARAVARRVAELVETGEAEPGEIVLLFSAGTDAEVFEEELRAAGLPTYRATGRGYFGQQQVVDLLAYLRLLHNRYDDEALVTVLASPFVGLSNDALVLLRRAAEKRPLFVGVEKGVPGIGTDDGRLLQAFRQRYDRLAALAARVGLERLCEQIVVEHDYDLAVLAQWDGRRRYANLRKLARLARSFEELRGADIEGFVRFVLEQDAAGVKELEAVAEEEGVGAVRLLTIHAAKGLEFKVVVVADAGRERPRASGEEIICLPDGRFGFKVVDPATGRRKPAFAYDEVRGAEEAAEEAERLRLYYVAMTRAIDRLIVSGSVDLARRDGRTPIAWVLDRLGLDELEEGEVVRGDARLAIRVDRYAPPAPAAAEAAALDEQLSLFAAPVGAVPAQAPELPPLAAIDVPPGDRVRRLSYSALALFARCPYRFYAERIAGLRPADSSGRIPGQTGLAATEIGDAVHRLLESPAPVGQVRSWYPAATDEELGRIDALVHAHAGSSLAGRIAELDAAHPERTFAFEHDGVLFHGVLDVLHLADGRALVVDFKSNMLGELSPAEVVDADYRLQRLVYAIACFRAGADEVELVYQFLERPDELVSAVFARAELPTLEAELSEAIAEIQSGRFPPRPSEFACAGCPALDVVCAGPNLRG
ncbi:MAG TPA: UvrD-helicase domain-containing protein [Gaiellaceae bacterium]|nr:UvrD-helicase domain-containing protein [Gaiellaceae bacterium]